MLQLVAKSLKITAFGLDTQCGPLGWNANKHEELLDCSCTLQHRICNPVVRPSCPISPRVHFHLVHHVFLCVYVGNLFVDYTVDFAPGAAKRSHCQTNTQIPQPHALQWRISTACWLTNHNRQTGNSCMHPPYSLLKATCKRRVQRSHQPLMYVSAIESAKSYWQARSSKFKQASILYIRQVACWSLLASAKFKVQSSNKPSPLYTSAMQSAGLPANANSK